MPKNMLAYNPTLGLIESHVAIYKIYVLRNPSTEEIFYVGQTKMSLENRLSGHISETGANRDKIHYIKSILETGQKPIIEAIETIATTCYIDTMAVNEREIYWIKYYKSLGCNLLNIASTSPNTKCHEYHGYLSAIKKGQTSWHYYYCGKTAGGYSVYDEAKLKADGFRLTPYVPIETGVSIRREHKFNPFEYEKSRIKLGLPVEEDKKQVTTDEYPIQPSWSKEFKDSIPPYKTMRVYLALEMQNDDCDLEWDELENDMSDYEPDNDEEDDLVAELDESEFYRSMYLNGLKILTD